MKTTKTWIRNLCDDLDRVLMMLAIVRTKSEESIESLSDQYESRVCRGRIEKKGGRLHLSLIRPLRKKTIRKLHLVLGVVVSAHRSSACAGLVYYKKVRILHCIEVIDCFTFLKNDRSFICEPTNMNVR